MEPDSLVPAAHLCEEWPALVGVVVNSPMVERFGIDPVEVIIVASRERDRSAEPDRDVSPALRAFAIERGLPEQKAAFLFVAWATIRVLLLAMADNEVAG